MESMETLRIACAQMSVHADESLDSFENRLCELAQSAQAQSADFLLLPEYFSGPLLSAHPNLEPEAGIQKLAQTYAPKVHARLTDLAQSTGLYIIGGSQPQSNGAQLANICEIFTPKGDVIAQPKLHITPSEASEWQIQGGSTLAVIKTPKASIGMQICYDIEFPEASRLLAEAGVDLIFVPYCTEDIHGHHRVNLCARARAIENQIYIATAGLVGELPTVSNLEKHYAQSAIYGPPDLGLPGDGIIAQAHPEVESLLVAEISLAALREIRERGSVRPNIARRTDLFDLQPVSLKINHYA